MTTQINITVDSGGLTDRAKQQQQAARQAQLEKERQQRIEAQGQKQRDDALASQGRAPDGSSLSNTNSTTPKIERRPAAQRSDTFKVGHTWLIQRTSESLTANKALFTLFGSTGRAVPSSITYRYLQKVKPLSGNGSTSTETTASTPSNEPIESPPVLNVTITGYSKQGSLYGPNIGSDFYMGEMQVVTGDSYDAGIAYFCLPAGKDKFILIEQAWAVYGQSIGTHNFYYTVDRSNGVYSPNTTSYWGQNADFISYSDTTGEAIATYPVPSATGFKKHEIKTDYTFTRKAYLCSNNTLREITLPSTLKSILLQLYPEPQIVPSSGGTNAYRDVTYGRDYYVPVAGLVSPLRSGIQYVLRSSTVYDGLQNISTVNVYSPDIFDVLNFYVPYSTSTKLSLIHI